MASSASGQDEPNRELWLASRAGKMETSCPLGTTRCNPQEKNFPESQIINPLLTKFVRSRWLDIDLVLFLRVYGPRLHLGPLTRKKRTWPISSHLDLTLGRKPIHIDKLCWKSAKKHEIKVDQGCRHRDRFNIEGLVFSRSIECT